MCHRDFLLKIGMPVTLASQLCRLSDNPITNYPPLAFSARISSLAEEVRNGMLTEEGSISPEFFTKQWKTVFSCDSEGLLYGSIIAASNN
ncbi:hypothetical protein M514_19657 [Trichuris suis]|uniref:Uncharacterized protein n=1 Tax=Trichuris suis TaxID=68888 RepID=A0A085NFC9_9BILA|nr:hypothetical protein M514_19657 [Trichuris suis]